jgi:hypothetical protein
MLLYVWNILEITSSSDSDVDRYVIIKNIFDSIFSTRWTPKSPYWRSRWTHGDFSSVRLATQDMTYPHRCFAQNKDLSWSRRWLRWLVSRGLWQVVRYNLPTFLRRTDKLLPDCTMSHIWRNCSSSVIDFCYCNLSLCDACQTLPQYSQRHNIRKF